MAATKLTSREAPFFNLSQAKWVVGVLSMLIAVVGKDSLLGLLLRQTRSEINTVIRDEGPQAARPTGLPYENN